MLETKISDLTVDEFRALMRDIVRQTLDEALNDPDEGLSLRDGLEEALNHSINAVNEGAPTYDAEDAAKRLGIKW
ncbi:MAG: hypothetical protein MUO77_01020 [Anaerolineales bacterium]|nr:hypothetical protein [Anaerolineales bacterium]